MGRREGPPFTTACRFSQTTSRGLEKITREVLVMMHGEDDQIVPYADPGRCPRSYCRTGR